MKTLLCLFITLCSGLYFSLMMPGENVYNKSIDAKLNAATIKTNEKNYPFIENIKILDTFLTVYNLEVEDAHNYFVGRQGILVHNTNCKLWTAITKQILASKDKSKAIDKLLTDDMAMQLAEELGTLSKKVSEYKKADKLSIELFDKMQVMEKHAQESGALVDTGDDLLNIINKEDFLNKHYPGYKQISEEFGSATDVCEKLIGEIKSTVAAELKKRVLD